MSLSDVSSVSVPYIPERMIPYCITITSLENNYPSSHSGYTKDAIIYFSWSNTYPTASGNCLSLTNSPVDGVWLGVESGGIGIAFGSVGITITARNYNFNGRYRIDIYKLSR